MQTCISCLIIIFKYGVFINVCIILSSAIPIAVYMYDVCNTYILHKLIIIHIPNLLVWVFDTAMVLKLCLLTTIKKKSLPS